MNRIYLTDVYFLSKMLWFVAVVVSDMCWSWCLLLLTTNVSSFPLPHQQHHPWVLACGSPSRGSVAPAVVSWEAPAPKSDALKFMTRSIIQSSMMSCSWVHWIILQHLSIVCFTSLLFCCLFQCDQIGVGQWTSILTCKCS